MPRVLFITTENLHGTSGATISTAELVRAMADSEAIDLSLIAPAPDGPSPVPDSVSTYWLTPKPAGTIKWHLKHQPSMARALLTALIRERPDEVIIRIGPSTVIPIALGVLPGVEYKALVRGIVHRNLSIQRPVKAAVWANTTVADEAFASFEAVAEMLDELGVDREVKVIPNAVTPERFSPVDGPPPESIAPVTADAEFVIGFVGTMEERHRVDVLVEAVASLPDSMKTALVLVGDGPQRAKLEALVENTGIDDRTVFTGLVDFEEVPRYISACDVLYGISAFDKPSNPNKVYEYLACERPVITTRTPELGFVGSEELGVAMEEITVESVREALVELSETTPEERATMGRRGREYVSQHNSWAVVVDELLGVES
jgi:glycosyltransferase involved in cell wall biosynthesis